MSTGDYKCATPVVMIIFNRPDTAEAVFEHVRKAQPPKLLLIGDGARQNKQGELEKVLKTREIAQKVDWNCEVLTNFSDENLGCKKRISSGLDWVFSIVDRAIILEDDFKPADTFFRFCDEML
ncbi:MAG: nucleotide-diphospho-sugar transferase, partial [Spirochaetaceae bacterium]|nr:nucleotide-diphospho-sugar transferase [Spirochaetaceae bacterium]